ncbi:MAG: aminodeoxychorismate/anthranilate synthase component II [Bacteroidales bacterium]|nr:aminodeoxychorismate/anthranilate synthase component II [Bacteroidales bacterium]
MKTPKVLIVDNYDSFTWNLVNIVRKGKHPNYVVKRNDAFDLSFVDGFDKILFSPGPDVPHHGDMMWQILDIYQTTKSILGICLGFQAIGMYFGARLFNLQKVYHGQTRQVEILDQEETLFSGIDNPFTGGLYHSWGIHWDGFPEELIVTARSEENRIMALRHRSCDIRGLQFHPESIMTPRGEQMINNWLNSQH